MAVKENFLVLVQIGKYCRKHTSNKLVYIKFTINRTNDLYLIATRVYPLKVLLNLENFTLYRIPLAYVTSHTLPIL